MTETSSAIPPEVPRDTRESEKGHLNGPAVRLPPQQSTLLPHPSAAYCDAVEEYHGIVGR